MFNDLEFWEKVITIVGGIITILVAVVATFKWMGSQFGRVRLAREEAIRQQAQEEFNAAMKQERESWQAQKDALETRIGKLESGKPTKEDQIQAVKEALRKHVLAMEERLSQADEFGVWMAPPKTSFKKKHGPIVISVVNLKGGVGKSTISANLGAEFADKGKRVVMVDLDWQSSLTRLSLSEIQTTTFFESKSRPAPLSIALTEYAKDRDWLKHGPIPERVVRYGHERSPLWIVPTKYTLMEAEDLALLKWYSGHTDEDARFIVSHLIQRWTTEDGEFGGKPDVVIIDCPPRFTISMTGALACSDVVLMPIIPDDVSSEAVGQFFSAPLEGLRNALWQDRESRARSESYPLPVFATVANKVKSSKKRISNAKGLLDDLETVFSTTHPDLMFNTSRALIPETVSFADAAKVDRSRSFARDINANVKAEFAKLASDLLSWVDANRPQDANRIPQVMEEVK